MSEIEVHADLKGVTHRVGLLRLMIRHGRNSSVFTYDPAWRKNPESFSLEPALQVGEGVFTPDRGRDLFASLGDSAPDSWGRRLMQRMERRTASREGRTVRTLTETDYLLGVTDLVRLGALRFRRVGDTDFQAPLRTNGIPPLVELPRLLAGAERILRQEEDDEDLQLLFAPGSSLGGARPKASIQDRDGCLSIAKFPRDDDDISIESWEAVALRLAVTAKITVANSRLERINGRSVLLSHRFDRDESGQRIPFLSAMAMIGAMDGERRSYPEIVEALRAQGAHADIDAVELFRRMAFNIMIRNVDDHLRNHGFLWRGTAGWRLSPAYDLNPVPADLKAPILSTNISLDEGTCSIDLACENADWFGLSKRRAEIIIGEVAIATEQWRKVAAALSIRPAEIERMETAFEHEDAKTGRRLASRLPSS